MRRWLKRFWVANCVDLGFDSMLATTARSIGRYLSRRPDTRFGSNDLTYSALRADGIFVCIVLANTSRRAQSGYGFRFGSRNCEVIQPFHAFRQAWDGALVMLDDCGPCMAQEASR